MLAVAVPLLAQEDLDDRTEENRKLLEKWRQEPAHLARLQHDLAFFQQLSSERQQRLRKLDRDLQEENPAQRARFGRVLQRYADWLDLCRRPTGEPSSRPRTERHGWSGCAKFASGNGSAACPAPSGNRSRKRPGSSGRNWFANSGTSNGRRGQDWQIAATAWRCPQARGDGPGPCRRRCRPTRRSLSGKACGPC